ncbi:MAG: DUF2063 domain-containing protein [Thiothrix sp.]
MNVTATYQRAFAAYLRDPQHCPVPHGVDAQRAAVYANLLFNNMEDFLSNALPVTHSLLSKAAWQDLVRQFFVEHACQSPYFRDIAGEFVQWLTARCASLALSTCYPFLLELVHYEWVEIPLLLDATEPDWAAIDTEGDWLMQVPALNPVMLLQTYQYPVHKICRDYLPQVPEPTTIVLVKNPQGKIDFMVISAATAHLLALLQQNLTGQAALEQLATAMQHPDPAQLLAYGVQLLTQLQQQHILLGVYR